MKKGRRYIEPMTGRGDKAVKKRDVKKIKREAAEKRRRKTMGKSSRSRQKI